MSKEKREPIDRYKDELIDNIGDDANLISALIIYPSDVSFKSLTRILLIDKKLDPNPTRNKGYYIEGKYLDLEREFIGQEENRSLAFLKYDEPVMYHQTSSKRLDGKPRKESKGDTNVLSEIKKVSALDYEIHRFEPFPLKVLEDNLKNVADRESTAEILDKYWKSWTDIIDNSEHFKSAKSTLWSYVVIRRTEERIKEREIICSAYLIFDRPVEKKKHILNKISQDFLYLHVTEEFFKDIKLQATRSAISQVMARNTSHNLGAHVMNKLIDPNALGNFCSYKDCMRSYMPLIDLEDVNNHKPLHQIAIFNNYIKCRMDYLADISFGTPLMQTNKYAYKDLFKELDKVRLLLEYISGLSDFKYLIRFQKNGEDLSEENDLLVAIPNDILGMQAFYNILENIIRNTAKYGKSDRKGSVTFTVNFIDELKNPQNDQRPILMEFIAVEVYDSIDIPDGQKNDEGGNENKQSSTDDSLNINQLVDRQNQWLNKDVLEDNKLRSSSLGLIEMSASAAYLRKRNISFINHPSYEIQYDETWSRDNEVDTHGTVCRHFLKAFKKTDGVHNHLGYRFFLHRPAVALIVIDKDTFESNEEAIEGLGKLGIRLIKTDDFKQELIDGKVFNHEFVFHAELDLETIKVYSEEGTKNIPILSYYKTSLPVRILKLGNEELGDLIRSSDFEGDSWFKWIERLCLPEVDIRNKKPEKSISGVFSAIFLDHLYDIEESQIQSVWNLNEEAEYVEALSSLGQNRLPDYNTLNKGDGSKSSTDKFKNYLTLLNYNHIRKGQNLTTYKKLVEAVISKIIVLDERVQEASENQYFMNVGYNRLYKKMNVIVPSKSLLNLSQESIGSDFINDLDAFLENALKYIKPVDHILIHYSILERVYSKNNDINRWLEKFSDRINVVVTSGRGTPNGLSKSVRFVNLSSVITAFIDIRSKYSICSLLNSSRKSNR